MRKQFFIFLSLVLASVSVAETVQLKDGSFISGSITSQTEYTLNLRTSYGPVVLNQREVQAILPDKHRVHLKGGTQLIGIITDLDEFNLKLQTDEGIVNIDMPQILSVETYDYEQGDTAQKNIAQRQAAQQAQEATATQVATGAAAATAGGLTFDSDIEKVFDVKKADVVNGQVQTVQEISAAEIRARQAAAMSDEEAFLKGVSKEQNITKNAEAARSGKLEKTKKAAAKKAARPQEKATNKFFALSAGVQTNDLKLDNSQRDGFAGTDPYDVGGTSVRVEGTFLWRLGDSNVWFGPSLAIANISKNSFTDLDPNIGPNPDTTDVTTSGQLIDIMAKANYYFNPNSLFVFYVTAAGGYRFLTLNYHGVLRGENINTGSFLGAAGIGVQTYLDDVLVGLEATEHIHSYSKEFKDSSSTNTVVSLTFSWKF